MPLLISYFRQSNFTVNMDPNENNNLIESVQLELITIKGEVKEEPLEDADNTNQAIYFTQTNVHGIFDNSNDSSVSGQKRKHSEENSLNVQEEDRMSNTSNSSKANVKRRRYSISQGEVPLTNSNPEMSAHRSQDRQERGTFTLYVTNTPGEWTSNEIIDYIREQCGIHLSKINDSREANSNGDFQIKLKFSNRDHLNRVFLKLKEKEVEGKLTAQVDDVQDDSQSEAESEAIAQIGQRDSGAAEETTENPQNIESDENSFHIKEDYLRTLGIKLPLTNWVTVTNFRCDKSELREVLELCGKVLICTVVTVNSKYANVMYSHPLEAVQAISMLNGQKLYGKPLKLSMNSAVDMRTLLPKSLADVGPGLGKFGIPVPDLVDQYKKFMEGKNSSIDAHLFQPDLLNKLGVSLNEDSSYIRPVNNSPSIEGNMSDLSRDSSPNIQNVLTSQFGPIGQRPPRPRSNPTNNMPQFHNKPISNLNSQPIIRTNGPNVPIGVNNSNNPEPMQGPRGPNPGAIIFSNCPPLPSVSNDARSIHNGSVRPGPISGPIGPTGHSGPMGPRPIGPMVSPSPRIPIAAPTNRFPGSVSPMMGPRPVGPRPVGPSGPVSSIGQVGPMGQVGPIGQVGQMGQVGPIGQVGPMGQVGGLVGPMGKVGPIGQVGSMGQVGGQVVPMGQAGPIGQVGPINQAGPVVQISPRGPVPRGPGPRGHGPRGPGPRGPGPIGSGPRGPGPNAQMQNQNIPVSNIRSIMPGPGPGPYMAQPVVAGCNVQMFKGNDPVTLQISNLPPTTNFLNLGQKLSELGHVVFLEFTTPGCAVVRFANPSDAERCFQNYRKVLA